MPKAVRRGVRFGKADATCVRVRVGGDMSEVGTIPIGRIRVVRAILENLEREASRDPRVLRLRTQLAEALDVMTARIEANDPRGAESALQGAERVFQQLERERKRSSG